MKTLNFRFHPWLNALGLGFAYLFCGHAVAQDNISIVDSVNPWVIDQFGGKVVTDRYYDTTDGTLFDRHQNGYPQTSAGLFFNRYYQPDATLGLNPTQNNQKNPTLETGPAFSENRVVITDSINPWARDRYGKTVQSDRYVYDAAGRLYDRHTQAYPKTPSGLFFNRYYQPDSQLSSAKSSSSPSIRTASTPPFRSGRLVADTSAKPRAEENKLDRFTCRGQFHWGFGQRADASIRVGRRPDGRVSFYAYESVNRGNFEATLTPNWELQSLDSNAKKFLDDTFDDETAANVAFVQKVVGADYRDVGTSSEFLLYRWFGANGQYMGSSGSIGFHPFKCVEGPAMGIHVVSGTTEILEVGTNSAAETAGLKTGDKILSVNGEEVGNHAELMEALKQHKAGSTIPIRIDRHGEVIQKNIKLGEVNSHGIDPDLPAVRFYPTVFDVTGYRVETVTPNGPAEKAGLKPGDVVTHVNGKHVRNAYESHPGSRISEFGNEKSVTIDVIRNGKPIQIEFPITFDEENHKIRNRPILGVDMLSRSGYETVIGDFVQGSQAEAVGLKRRDRIKAINGVAVNSSEQLLAELDKYKPGDSVKVDVVRKSEERGVEKLTREVPLEPAFKLLPLGQVHVGLDGEKEGSLVDARGIIPGSPADAAGIKMFDQLIEFDGKPVRAASDISKRVRQHRIGDRVNIKIIRDGVKMEKTITLGPLADLK